MPPGGARAYAIDEDPERVTELVRARAGEQAELEVSYGPDTVTVTVSAPVDPMWSAAGIEATSTKVALVEAR